MKVHSRKMVHVGDDGECLWRVERALQKENINWESLGGEPNRTSQNSKMARRRRYISASLLCHYIAV